MEKNPPLSPKQFDEIISHFNIPEIYEALKRAFNGGKEAAGPGSWLIPDPIDELHQKNENYKILPEDIPEYFLLGKDAADTGYAFHNTKGTFHSLGLLSNFDTGPIEFLGNDFIEFSDWLNDYRQAQ